MYASFVNAGTDEIYQYDLSSNNSATILASKKMIDTSTFVRAFQLGPDGKLYIANFSSTTLSVINNPNVVGVGCNFSRGSISLAGRLNMLGLPNFIESYFNPGYQYISIHPANVSPDVTIDLGDNTSLIATSGIHYNWYPSLGLNCTNCSTVMASPVQTTMYCASVTDSLGCIDTACVTVMVRNFCDGFDAVEMPNVFSPNNDGSNDVFYLEGWDGCINTFEMAVYNRWGVKMFESTNVNVVWDGRISNGTEAPEGTYYYILNMTEKNGEQKDNRFCFVGSIIHFIRSSEKYFFNNTPLIPSGRGEYKC